MFLGRVYRILLVGCLLIALSGTVWAAASYPIIVEIAADADIKQVAHALQAKVLDQLPEARTYLLSVSSLSPSAYLTPGIIHLESSVTAAVGKLRIGVLSTHGTAADWYRNQPALKLIHADAAQAYSTGVGVVIADINSLVDYSHPTLLGHLTGGYDFVSGRPSEAHLDQSSSSFLDQSSSAFLDQSTASFLDQSAASFLDQSSTSFLDATNPAHGHGTLVAGIIAAIAPQSMIMPLRVFDDQGQADAFAIAKAIRYATDHGAHIINMSFGVTDQSKMLDDAIAYADKAGVVLVASAGNNNSDDPQYPAASDKVIGIGATDLLDLRAPFSNYGASVEVTAPGVNIISGYPGGYYALVSGTSFSAPIVAAEAALIRSFQMKNNARDKIGKGTVNIDHRNPGFAKKLGQGRIDVLYGIKDKK